jgi:hypothetical protein
MQQLQALESLKTWHCEIAGLLLLMMLLPLWPHSLVPAISLPALLHGLCMRR